MNDKRKNLLTFGYVRELCKFQNIAFSPDDIIGLLIVWLLFGDHFDEYKSHPKLKLEMVDKYPTAT